jgi:hypothetical protein
MTEQRSKVQDAKVEIEVERDDRAKVVHWLQSNRMTFCDRPLSVVHHSIRPCASVMQDSKARSSVMQDSKACSSIMRGGEPCSRQ